MRLFSATVSFPYDLTLFKSFENLNSKEMSRRFRAVALIFLVGLFLDQNGWTIAGWAVAYLTSLFFYVKWVQKLPDQIGKAQFRKVVAARFFVLSLFMFLPLFAWSHQDFMYRVCGFIAAIGPMMNAMSARGREPLLRTTDLISVGGAYLIMSLEVFILSQDFIGGLFFAFVLLVLFTYFFQAVRDAVRTRTELENVRSAQIKEERLRSLGQLTGGVAHDFNNLLTVIIGNVNLLEETVDLKDEMARELMREIDGAAQRAADLTAQLLIFSRKSELEAREVSLGEALAKSEMLIRRLLPATHTLSMDLRSDKTVLVDYKRLENVLVNLVINARDAMVDGGTIRVTLDEMAPPERLSGNKALRLSVVDTGIGIPEDIRDRVLEPFFTTKPVGKGSGLGLSMALGFAEQSGGILTLRSKEGQGTRVSIWLPVLPEVERVEVHDKPRGMSAPVQGAVEGT